MQKALQTYNTSNHEQLSRALEVVDAQDDARLILDMKFDAGWDSVKQTYNPDTLVGPRVLGNIKALKETMNLNIDFFDTAQFMQFYNAIPKDMHEKVFVGYQGDVRPLRQFVIDDDALMIGLFKSMAFKPGIKNGLPKLKSYIESENGRSRISMFPRFFNFQAKSKDCERFHVFPESENTTIYAKSQMTRDNKNLDTKRLEDGRIREDGAVYVEPALRLGLKINTLSMGDAQPVLQKTMGVIAVPVLPEMDKVNKARRDILFSSVSGHERRQDFWLGVTDEKQTTHIDPQGVIPGLSDI